MSIVWLTLPIFNIISIISIIIDVLMLVLIAVGWDNLR
jgi:hypothetical protein